MAGYRNLIDALKAGDVDIIETNRGKAMELVLGPASIHMPEKLTSALDENAHKRIDPGMSRYVVIKINGGTDSPHEGD